MTAALGIDLAWSERNPSGCAAYAGDGRLLDERLVTTDDEVLEWVGRWAAEVAALAIDAPLEVPNLAGRRPCESELHRVYGGRKAGPHSSNRTLLEGRDGRIRGEDLRAKLLDEGWGDPWAESQRTLIEVYPHPALIEMFDLDERLVYKKGRVATRRMGLRRLDRMIQTLAEADPPLRATPHQIDESVRGRALKGVEDQLDARICAWVAALWLRDPRRIRLFGSAMSGHIAVPIGSAFPRRATPDPA